MCVIDVTHCDWIVWIECVHVCMCVNCHVCDVNAWEHTYFPYTQYSYETHHHVCDPILKLASDLCFQSLQFLRDGCVRSVAQSPDQTRIWYLSNNATATKESSKFTMPLVKHYYKIFGKISYPDPK